MAQLEVKLTQQSRLYEDVADQLREAILSGRFQTGERLPTETELTSQFGVSRAVVRQATLSLEHDGLVNVRVGATGGTYVRPSDARPVLRALENYLRHSNVSVHDYLRAKRLIEPCVIEDVVRFSGHEHRLRLETNLEAFASALQREAGDDELLSLSLDFHEILFEAIGNPVLEVMLSALVRIAERVPDFKSVHHHDWAQILVDHRALLGALEANDQREFRALMLGHLESVETIYTSLGNDEVR